MGIEDINFGITTTGDVSGIKKVGNEFDLLAEKVINYGNKIKYATSKLKMLGIDPEYTSKFKLLNDYAQSLSKTDFSQFLNNLRSGGGLYKQMADDIQKARNQQLELIKQTQKQAEIAKANYVPSRQELFDKVKLDATSAQFKKVRADATALYKQFKRVSDVDFQRITNSLKNMGKHAKEVAKEMETLRKGARTFQFHWLGIMFAGMALKRFAEGAIKGIFEVFNKANEGANALNQQTNKLTGAWEYFKYSIAQALAESPVFQWLIDKISELFDWLSDRPEGFLQFLGNLLLIAIPVGAIMMFIGQVMLGLNSIRIAYLLGQFSWLGKLFTWFKVTAIPALIGAFKWLWTVLLTNPLFWIILGIVLLSINLILLANKMKEFGGFWKTLWNGIQEIFWTATIQIADKMEWFVNNVIVNMVNGIISAISWLKKLVGMEGISWRMEDVDLTTGLYKKYYAWRAERSKDAIEVGYKDRTDESFKDFWAGDEGVWSTNNFQDLLGIQQGITAETDNTITSLGGVDSEIANINSALDDSVDTTNEFNISAGMVGDNMKAITDQIYGTGGEGAGTLNALTNATDKSELWSGHTFDIKSNLEGIDGKTYSYDIVENKTVRTYYEHGYEDPIQQQSVFTG